MRQILLDHQARYPLSEAQDYLKLLYQSEFGGGHLIENPQWALDYLKKELREMQPSDAPGLEPIGGGLCRLHLQKLDALGLRPETVLGLFLETCRPRGSMENLENKLRLLTEILPGAEAAVNEYRAAGCPSVRHSATYRAAYHPAYRLAPIEAKKFLPLFQKIDALLAEKPFVRVAIDGPCASGKSTLGELLSRVYGANLFHMDDYFLPFPRKTPERMAEPGGNVDYERFYEEIASRTAGAPVRWHAFDCSVQALGPELTAQPTALTVVEGSYSLHPTLRDAYDLKIFLRIPPEVQSARILKRNGPEMHKMFIEKWIPLENHYFTALNIESLCDLRFDCGEE